MATTLFNPKGVAAALKVLQGGGKDWAQFVDCVERRGFGRTEWGFEEYDFTMRRWRRLISEGSEEGPSFIPAGNGAAVVVVILVAVCGADGQFEDASVAKAMRTALQSWLGPDPFPVDESGDWLSQFVAQCRAVGDNKDQLVNGLFKRYLWKKAA